MRHPLLKAHNEVRKRMIAVLRDGLLVRRAGNLVFVCGGNDRTHMRPRFCEYLTDDSPDYKVFQPEFAMKNYFSDEHGGQLDLGKFEELVGELSHAIVIFPEAPGSFAETGYFSKTPPLAKKTILVLNSQYQSNDSFIMMGPARRIEEISKFNPNLQIDFENPDFSVVVHRIKRFELPKTRKALDVDDLSDYDLFCLIYKIFDLLIVATYEDLVKVFNSLTTGHAPKRQIKDVASILVGAGFVERIGEFGHYACLPVGQSLIKVRDGWAEEEFGLKLEIGGILRETSPEFAGLLEERSNAH